MTGDTWRSLLRIVSFFAAIALWVVSVYFSSDGFGIKVPGKMWIGVILALCVTVLELVFNRDGMSHNLTLIVAGISAYAYGIWTNVIGIMAAQGVVDYAANLGFEMVFPLIVALFLEVVPEPLLIWALMGVSTEDLLSNLFGSKKSSPFPSRPPTPFRPPMSDLNSDAPPMSFGPRNIAERKHPHVRQ